MKKFIIAAISALLLMALLISCGYKGSPASPGNLNPPTAKTVPHTSTGESDVSSEYLAQLCAEYWLDTNSMHCCSLGEDGSYFWIQSKKDPRQIASGSWKLTQDDQAFLSLYLTDSDSGETLTLHEIELYETSIYALDDEGNAVVWLTTQPAGESEA